MTPAPRWIPAYVGVGSNLSTPERQVQKGLAAIADLPDVGWYRASSLYSSAPMGVISQPDYINAVCGFLTRLSALALLEALLGAERSAGRDRTSDVRWGPRVLDLDLLIYGSQTIEEPELVVPHPGISQRNFVLLPLAEISPDVMIPGLGRAVALARSTDRTTIRRIE